MTDNTEERIWAYMVKHRDADIEEIMLNTDASSDEVVALIQRIGSPNWRDELEPTPLGGIKFDQGKPRYDLIPPEIEDAIATVMTFGAAKYGDRNWEKGMNWGRAYAALRRHMGAWWGGENSDPETGMPHTWHAACCIAFLVAFEARGAGTDDRPKRDA